MKRRIALAAALVMAACARPWWAPSGCPVTPVPSAELPGDLYLRARIAFEIDERTAFVEVVAQSSPEELSVVGIAPYGARIFAVAQHDRVIAVEPATLEHEHLARWTVDALHRTTWIRPPTHVGAGPVVSWFREGEQVTESREGDEHTRVFSRSNERARVQVAYRERVAEIENPWCGYRAIVAVLDASSPGRAE